LGPKFDEKFNEKSLLGIPDWLAMTVLDNIAKNEYTPKTIEEAKNQSKEIGEQNALVRFTLKSVSELIRTGKAEAGYQGYDGTKSIGITAKGDSYNRKFTHTFRLSTEASTPLNDGVNAAIDLKIDYTLEKKED